MNSSDSDQKTGRPSSYKPKYDQKAYELTVLGHTNAELADFFEVSKNTINNWRHEYPSFYDAIKRGKEIADSEVAMSLYQRARGYEHPEDKIFLHQGEPVIVPTMKRYPPDTTAAIFFLKNRQPTKWRDKREVDANLKTTDMTEDQIEEKIRSMLAELGE